MDKPTLKASTPTDLIAMTPLVLGFHPEDSVVLLSFGGPEPFHARIDLPLTEDDRSQVVAMLIEPVRRHRIPTVAVLVYGDDQEAASCIGEELVLALTVAGSTVLDVLWVEDDCYHHLLRPELDPVPYDIANHPFAAEAVFMGRETKANRVELADQLIGGSEEEIDAIRQVAIANAGERPDQAADAEWIRQRVRLRPDDRVPMPVAEAGKLLVLLTDEGLRDVAWMCIPTEGAREMEEFWIDLVRRAPEEWLSAPAGLLAFTAWLAGDGALAWCAVDRCLGENPDYGMGQLMARLLKEAVPPSVWGSVASDRESRSA